MLSLRDDIILERIDNIWLLIALRPAWDVCPFAMPTIPVYADIWQAARDGKDEEEILELLEKDRGYSPEKAGHILNSFIKAARKNHYLIEDMDDTPEAGA